MKVTPDFLHPQTSLSLEKISLLCTKSRQTCKVSKQTTEGFRLSGVEGFNTCSIMGDSETSASIISQEAVRILRHQSMHICISICGRLLK